MESQLITVRCFTTMILIFQIKFTKRAFFHTAYNIYVELTHLVTVKKQIKQFTTKQILLICDSLATNVDNVRCSTV